MKNLIDPKFLKQAVAICFCAMLFACFVKAQIASGGNYMITQTAAASGGKSGAGASVNGNYSLEGSIAQNAAGTRQQNAPYALYPGFWTVQIFAPTAASITVGGRVLSAKGGGIRNVRVTMTNDGGATRTAVSNSFGYFRFEDTAAGETYIFSVFSERFTFSQPAQVRSILEDTDDLVFTADEI